MSSKISGFHGRVEELAWLKGLFHEASGGSPGANSCGPRMAIVVAESGFGKSRLVQALYQQLTVDPVWDPPEVNYWPDSFQELAQQLRVNPDLAGHDPKGPPRFLWLGMRWQQPDVRNVEERRCQLPEARSALHAHVETARHKQGSWKSLLAKSTDILKRQATDEVVSQLVDTFIPFGGLLKKAFETAREIVKDRSESNLSARDRTESKAKDAGEEMLDSLREVFRGRGALPTVLWLDDAQWIDNLTLQFLHQLWAEACQKKWPLLVVVTHWEREWRQLMLLADIERGASLARFEHCNGVSCRVLGAADAITLRNFLGAELPGLTQPQCELLLHKAAGNFLSMVENVGQLKKNKPNFVNRDISQSLSPAGEKMVKSWSDDRLRRVEQRFEELEDDVKQLLGWSSRLGLRFIRSIVVEFARSQGVSLDPERLLDECVNPLVILGEGSPLLREFRDRSFHAVARRHFDDYGADWEEGLTAALREKLTAAVDSCFDDVGEYVSDTTGSLLALESTERRDLLSMAMQVFESENDLPHGSQAFNLLLRARIISVSTDAADNLWERIRNATESWGDIDWLKVSPEIVGSGVRTELLDHLQTAGAFKLAKIVAASLLSIARSKHAEKPRSESLRDVSIYLTKLGDIELVEGNLAVARSMFAEGLEIQRSLEVQLGTPESLSDITGSLRRLGDIKKVEGNLTSARVYYLEDLEISRKLEDQLGTPKIRRGVSVTLERLGDIEVKEGNLAVAKSLYAEGLEIRRSLHDQVRTPKSLHDFSILLSRLGNIEEEEGNLTVARSLFAEGLDIARTLQQQLGTPKSLRGISISLDKLGRIEEAEGNLIVARSLYAEGLEIRRTLQEQLGTPESLSDVSISLDKLGRLEKAEGNLAGARSLFTECLEINRTLHAHLGTPKSLRSISLSLNRLGGIELTEGNLAGARSLFTECLEIDRSLQLQLRTPEILIDLSMSLEKLGDIEKAKSNLTVARSLFAEGLEIRRTLQAQLGTPSSQRNVAVSLHKLGGIEFAAGNLTVARSLFAECLKMARFLHVQCGTPKSLCDVLESINSIGDIEKAEGNFAVGRSLFVESLEIARTLQAQLGTPASLRNVFLSLSRLGGIEFAEGNLTDARSLYTESLEIASALQSRLASPESLQDIANCLYKISELEHQSGNIEFARKNYKKGYEIAGRLHNMIQTHDTLNLLIAFQKATQTV